MRALALSLLVVAGTAHADASLPGGQNGNGRFATNRPTWQGRCAERLERARDEAARITPVLAAGVVEASAFELEQAGDPTARDIADAVVLRVADGIGPLLVAEVVPALRRGTIDSVPQVGVRRTVPIIRRAVDECLAMAKSEMR